MRNYRRVGHLSQRLLLGAGRQSTTTILRYNNNSEWSLHLHRHHHRLVSFGSPCRSLSSSAAAEAANTNTNSNGAAIDVDVAAAAAKQQKSNNGIIIGRRHLQTAPECTKQEQQQQQRQQQQRPSYPWLRIILISDVYELDALPRLKTLIDVCKREGPPPEASTTLVCCAGDFLSPSLLSSLDKGAGMVDCLNAIGVTHVCFGNHETDFGPETIKDRILQSRFRWINTNMRELDDIVGVVTPEHEIITVSSSSGTGGGGGTTTTEDKTITVGLLGLLSDNPGLYKPDAFGGALIEPVHSATERIIRSNHLSSNRQVDVWIPMTHQGMVEDRIFAEKFKGGVFPVILGSHDHDIYNEQLADSRIVQTGMDAEVAAVIDLTWKVKDDSSHRPEVDVRMLNPTDFEPDPSVEKRVEGHQKILKQLEGAPLFWIHEYIDWEHSYCKRRLSNHPPPSSSFSTQNNRLGHETGSKAICTLLRMGMRAHCALINAGAVRRNKAYDNSHMFTWSDLKAEVLFPTEMTAINLPGKVLEATIAHSRRFSRRTPPVGKGGYLHACNHIDFDDKHQRIRLMNGRDFDPEKLYLTALPSCFFGGIDNHEPLLEWAADQKLHIDGETGIPAKMILVQVLYAFVWLELGSFEEIDLNRDGVLTRDEVRARIQQVYGIEVADLVLDSIFSVCDLDADGIISPVEMMIVQCIAMDMSNYDTEGLKAMTDIASRTLGENPSLEDVKSMIRNVRDTAYIDDDGKIRGEEVVRSLAEFNVGRNLLT